MSRARDIADGTFSGAFSADSPTLVVDDANNRVGVGTASPTTGAIHIAGDYASNQSDITLQNTNGGRTYRIGDGVGGHVGKLTFFDGTASAARMVIDSSGNLLVGKTSTGYNTSAGTELWSNGFSAFTRDNAQVSYFNRKTSDGDIVQFLKDGSTVGSIGVDGALFINSQGSSGYLRNAGTTEYIWSASAFRPNGDNTSSIGAAGDRFTQVYAASGTINTSDATEKQDVAELDEAEKRVATTAKGLIRKFRWISSVEEKGDDARIHVGVIAQDLKAAFEAEGLDAHRYGMFCSDTWWEVDKVIPAVEEVLDEEGNVITEAQPERTEKRTYYTAEEAPAGAVERTRLGVRYNQLLAFIIGAM